MPSFKFTRPWLFVAFVVSCWYGRVAADQSAADFYVRNLPGLPEDETPVKMHAGHIEVDSENNGNLFFWHFQNQHIAKKPRTVLWLNGGPGCSSEDGALMEIGPYRVNEDGSLRRNNGSWHEFANLLFVDNPVGTGFSFVNTNAYISELEQMAAHMILFLEQFFKIFPEYEMDDFYIAGESYAGQHIPHIAKAISDRNKKAANKWNLSGLLIGNGWISPPEQYDAYVSFSLENGLITKGDAVEQTIQHSLNDCHKEIEKTPGRVSYASCEAVLAGILQHTRKGTGSDACYNMYDIRLKDEYPSCGMNWPPDLNSVSPYLRKPEVLKALNLDGRKQTGWTECKSAVGSAFSAQKSVPSIKLLPDILKSVPVLLFSGAKDLICNHMGTEKLIGNMEWNGGKGMEVSAGNWAPRQNWTFEGEDAGFWQSARNLTYVRFRDASHMVPFDYPRRSVDMLNRFMSVDFDSIDAEIPDSHLEGSDQSGSSGGHTKTPVDGEETDDKVTEAKWEAYQKSGEIVLVIVIVAVTVWVYFLWRARRRNAAYSALRTDDIGANRSNLRRRQGDLEASEFDETQLDDLHVESPQIGTEGKYAIGDEESDVEERAGAGSRA